MSETSAPPSDMASPVISLHGVGKAYRVYRRPQDRLKQMLFVRFVRHYEHSYWALQDIDLGGSARRNRRVDQPQRRRQIDAAGDCLRYADAVHRRSQGGGARNGLASRIPGSRSAAEKRPRSLGISLIGELGLKLL
jgi:hypothetical protein